LIKLAIELAYKQEIMFDLFQLRLQG